MKKYLHITNKLPEPSIIMVSIIAPNNFVKIHWFLKKEKRNHNMPPFWPEDGAKGLQN